MKIKRMFTSLTVAALVGATSVAAFAQTSNDDSEERVIVNGIDYTDVEFTRRDVKKQIKRILGELKADFEGKNTLGLASYKGFKRDIDLFADHPEIEEQTKIKEVWFRTLSKYLVFLMRAKGEAASQYSKTPAELAKAIKIYEAGLKKFVKLARNPVRISSKDRKDRRSKRR